MQRFGLASLKHRRQLLFVLEMDPARGKGIFIPLILFFFLFGVYLWR